MTTRNNTIQNENADENEAVVFSVSFRARNEFTLNGQTLKAGDVISNEIFEKNKDFFTTNNLIIKGK